MCAKYRYFLNRTEELIYLCLGAIEQRINFSSLMTFLASFHSPLFYTIYFEPLPDYDLKRLRTTG